MGKAIINGRQIFGNVHLGEGGDVANPNIADVYDPTQTYNTGDRRIYNDVLYVCNDDNVTGTWDSTKWDSATIDEIISALTADDIEYSSGVSVADKLDSLSTPIVDVDGTTITISHIDNIYTLGMKGCPVSSIYQVMANYTTSKFLRFVAWNFTSSKPVVISIGENTVYVIDASTWQVLPNTNNDQIHGGITYIKN